MAFHYRAQTVSFISVKVEQFYMKTAGVFILLTIFYVSGAFRTSGVDDVPKEEVLHRLLKVFGMEHPGKKHHHHLPPQYMLDLYNTIADDTGITRMMHPYRANIVRSFPDKDIGHPQRFHFNVTSSSIPAHEKVLEAEFHLYRMKRRSKKMQVMMSPLFEIRIYQVMFMNTTFTEKYNKLLDVRKISIHSSGWEVLYVKHAVEDWLKNPEKNFGLLVTVHNLFENSADFHKANFVTGQLHHVNKKPILVVFTDDGRKKMPRRLVNLPDIRIDDTNNTIQTDIKKNTSGILLAINASTDAVQENAVKAGVSRYERALADSIEIATSHSGCIRHELQVDFEKIGWSSWIISPKYYNAYFCKGECEFPLGQNQWPTNHATVQSIVHELNLYPGLETPCCVPSKLYSINLLYFDEYENVILKQYDDMVAASCGCH